MISYQHIYKHYKNGEHYIPLESCKIQENDVWVKAIIYKDMNGNKYVRSEKEFLTKFQMKEKNA